MLIRHTTLHPGTLVRDRTSRRLYAYPEGAELSERYEVVGILHLDLLDPSVARRLRDGCCVEIAAPPHHLVTLE